MPDSVLFWVIALSVAIPVVVVVAGSTTAGLHRRRLRRGGRTVKAIVSGLIVDAGDGLSSTAYWADVQYDDGGDFVTTRVSITRAEYDHFRVGTGVLVAYLPGQPSSARRLEELAR